MYCLGASWRRADPWYPSLQLSRPVEMQGHHVETLYPYRADLNRPAEQLKEG